MLYSKKFNEFLFGHQERAALESEYKDLRDMLKGLSRKQINDVRMLICDYAEAVLCIFEAHHPDDKRPRKAVKVGRRWASGKASEDEITAARTAAEFAVNTAYSTAWYGGAQKAAFEASWVSHAAVAPMDADSALDAAINAAKVAAWAVKDSSDWAMRDTAWDTTRKWQERKFLELFAQW